MELDITIAFSSPGSTQRPAAMSTHRSWVSGGAATMLKFVLVSSTFALVQWWLDHDMPYSPEKMGEYHARLIVRPTREAILNSVLKE